MVSDMKTAVIGDQVTVSGFLLGGFSLGYEVSDSTEARRKLEAVIAEKDVALIVITQNLTEEIKSFVNEIKKRKNAPIILEIPDKSGKDRSEEIISSIVKEVMGQ